MGWLEQRVRHYEHRRWAAEENRRVLPFGWGLEHIGGPPEPVSAEDTRRFLTRWADETLASSDEWFATTPADDDRLQDGVLTFTSAIRSPWAENNLVHARFFPAGHSGPAVVVLPQWNARWDAHVDICRWLNRLGITALRISLPYHDRRAVPGHDRDNFLVGPNIGLTLQANRQAVVDVRRCLRWLEQRGYTKLGILGTSIGSALSFIILAHDPAIRAGVCLHISAYFGDVVRTGLTTMHVWESLRAKVTTQEIRHFWAPISPFSYVARLSGSRQRLLMVTCRYDPSFWPEFSEQLLAEMRARGVAHDVLRLPCGHYSLDQPPFKYIAGLRFGTFLFQTLA